MTGLFALDQQANDSLLLDAEQRKQDLIDHAVRRFAPRLAGNPDAQVLHIHSTNSSLRKLIRELFTSEKTVCVEHCGPAKVKPKHGIHEVNYDGNYEGRTIPLPGSADMVVTKSSLNSKTEWLAARLGAIPVVLPEAADYVSARLEKEGVLILVGAEQAK